MLLIILAALTMCLPGPSGVFAQLADPTPQQIYERFAATVVFIVATPDHGTGMGGTGSIIRPDGLILTNAHVVVDTRDHRPYSQISIFLKPERVTGNPKTDLAKRFTARVIATSEHYCKPSRHPRSPPSPLAIPPRCVSEIECSPSAILSRVACGR
jgi:S1-C subfamily serine protease